MTMSEWINLHTLIAFVLGVVLAAWVKMMISQLQAKAKGA